MNNEAKVVSFHQDPWPGQVDVVFRWGCTATIPQNPKPTIINSAKAIHQVNDKAGFRKLVQDQHEGVVPKTWFDLDDWNLELPCIVRPRHHAQGKNLILAKEPDDLDKCLVRFGGDIYISEYIEKVAEYRVFVVQGRVACVAEKTPGNPDDIAWNVARGGRFDNVKWSEWPLDAIRTALVAFNCTELDFGGVDVMVDDTGRAYCLEINSAPSLTSPYRQQCMAKCFDYIVEKGKKRIPINPLMHEHWSKYIHPAVSEKAIIGADPL